jgi:uncharacterized protein YbjT (DUF2867 family)
MSAEKAVLVYGATGHTGRLVLAQLRREGWLPVLSGRDHARLTASARPGERVAPASVDDRVGLDAAAAGCVAVLNCAGPFASTADALIPAALRAGIPYLEIAAETDVTASHFDRHQAAALAAGVPVLPAVGFYGALGHLLARIAFGQAPDAGVITVAVGLDGWRPTPGTRDVMQRLNGRRLVYADARCRSGPVRQSRWSTTFQPRWVGARS